MPAPYAPDGVSGPNAPADIALGMRSLRRQHGSTFTGIGYSAPNIVPKREDLQRAAEVLNAGEKVAILIGAGARDAAEALDLFPQDDDVRLKARRETAREILPTMEVNI